MEIKRNTAHICNILDLVQGEFVKKEGWESSYIVTKLGSFSRVNILAVVVSKEDFLIVDDGSAKIQIRTFDNPAIFEKINVGDLVMIIGRPRIYGGEIYITPEIIRRIENKNWSDYRKKELMVLRGEISIKGSNVKDELKKETRDELKSGIITNANVENIEIVEDAVFSKDELILKIIIRLDLGDGVDIEDVVKEARSENAEEIINKMLRKGEIFEIKSGRVKIL